MQAASDLHRRKRNQQEDWGLSGSSGYRDNDDNLHGVNSHLSTQYIQQSYRAKQWLLESHCTDPLTRLVRLLSLRTTRPQCAYLATQQDVLASKILRYIVNSIDILREKDIKVELLREPAHIGIVEYK